MRTNPAIIISEKIDVTTDIIIEYLKYYKTPYVRINKDEVFDDISVQLSTNEAESVVLESGSKNIVISENQFVFYRRGGITKNYPFFSNHIVRNGLESDIENWQIYFHETLNCKLGDRNKEFYSNKLLNLKLAKKCGLSIPVTLSTTSKQVLLEFVHEYKKVISKPIRNGWYFSQDDIEFNFASTRLIDLNQIDQLSNSFGLTLFQAYVEKELELRIFFFYDRFFSMAIFSQQNEKTAIDFRNYDEDNPNRCVPFLLPPSIENKLLQLMQRIGLTTGSIDMILTPDNDFVFLEVNPCGQLEWLSLNCNYYIEKEIALHIKSQVIK